jgi:hypothetical protein
MQLLELLLNPTAGQAGFNLVAVMFYTMIALAVMVCANRH